MCNFYSLTKGQKAIRDLAKAMVDHAGNLPSLPGIFPDGMAPVVRTTYDGQRELLMMRWGFHRSGKAVPKWFALDDTRPLFFFAGIWRSWRGTRGTKANPVEGNHTLFSFLTTEPNKEVGEVHEKAMPVLLLTEHDRELWIQGETEQALTLQRAAPDGVLRLVRLIRVRGKTRDDGSCSGINPI